MCGGETSCEKMKKELFGHDIGPYEAPKIILGRIMAPNGEEF